MKSKTVGVCIAAGLVSFAVACVTMLLLDATWKEAMRLAVLALCVSPVIVYLVNRMSGATRKER